MPTTDKRVDAYIAKAAPFARPILERIREAVHEACPDCEETLKWSAPTFTHNGILVVMGAFKAHCALNFWRRAEVLADAPPDTSDRLGKLESVDDLPSKKVLAGYLRKAVQVNESGAPAPKRAAKAKPELPAPPALVTALRKSKEAKAGFDKLSPSHRREYIQWITEAKTEATRDKRIAQTVEWTAEGKSRNWKYM